MNHIENLPESDREFLNAIPGTRIAWNKTREEIWPEIMKRIEAGGSEIHKVKMIHLMFVRYAAAAVLTLLLGIPAVMYFYTTKVRTSQTQQIVTLLPDKSSVTLYSQSVLSYKPLLWKFSRTVRFEGDGFFEVQKGKKFEVVSENGKTAVLGTKFEIYSRDVDYKVTCFTGKVKVTGSLVRNEAIITGGQKAVLQPDGDFEISDLKDDNPSDNGNNGAKSLEEGIDQILTQSAGTKVSDKKENFSVPGKIQTPAKEQAQEAEEQKAKEKEIINQQVQQKTLILENNQVKTDLYESRPVQQMNKEESKDQEEPVQQTTSRQPVRDRFKASLSPEQVNILENQQMSREERRNAFMKSLSSEQLQLLKEQNEERARQEGKDAGDAVQNQNLKEQQKTDVRQQIQENNGNESKEQQKQQNRDNKNNNKP